MSHQTYNDLWAEKIQELAEQVQIENLSAQAQEAGQLYDTGFEHHSLLYIKYMQIAKKLEICYDQMVHPQKRADIRGLLETTLVRILELKEQLIFFNRRAKNPIVPFDEVLTDLKLPPETVDWTVPRYFTDDPDEADRIERRDKLIKYYLEKNQLPDMDDLVDTKHPFEVEITMDRDTAIRIIQKNERGRTGIVRAQNVAEWHMRMRKEAQRKEERAKKPAAEVRDPDGIEAQVFAATMIASHWKRKADRRRFLRLREEEFQFLGMSAPPPLEVDHVRLADEIRDKRKQSQREAELNLQRTMEDAKSWVREKQGPDIRAARLRYCRERLLEKTQQERKYPPKFPANLAAMYAEPEAEEPEPVKGAKPDDKKKPEEEPDAHLVGTSLTVQSIEQYIQEYHTKWGDGEKANFEQKPDVNRARDDVHDGVVQEIFQEVDSAIVVELDHLRKMYEKGKPPKIPKPPKPPKPIPEKKWCTVMEKNMTMERKRRFVKDVVAKGFLKLVKPCRLNDFVGEFAYMGQVNRVEERYASAPSAQMIKSLIVEHCILPLASQNIKKRLTKEFTARSVLIYGPRGTGKSMLARAIATEAGAAFFDISPSVIEGKYTKDKKDHELLVYHTMCAAEALSPSVVYIDNVEQVFKAQKKGKKAAGAEVEKDPPSRIQKAFTQYMKIAMKVGPDSVSGDGKDMPRVLIIGVTSKPFEEGVNQENMYNAFDFKVWTSFPDCGSRTLLLRQFIEAKGVTVDPVKINLSALAMACDGHSAGALGWAVERVLTTRRIQQLGVRPLQVAEFIGPLARTPACWPEEWAAFLDFDYRATGEKARFEEMQQRAQKLEAGADDPKKKK